MEKLLCELGRIAREVRYPVQRFRQVNAENLTALRSTSWSIKGASQGFQDDGLEESEQLCTEVQSARCCLEVACGESFSRSDPGVRMFGLETGTEWWRCRSIHALTEFQPRACFATSATARDRPRRPMKPVSDLLNLTKAPAHMDTQDDLEKPKVPVKQFGVISRQQLAQSAQDAGAGNKNQQKAAQSVLDESLGTRKPGARTSFSQILKSGGQSNPASEKSVQKRKPLQKEASGEKAVSIPVVEAPKIEALPPPSEPAPRPLPSWKVGLANREQRAAKAAAKEEGQRLNEEITARTVRLVELDGKGTSIVSIREAMAKARQAGVDLVEVNGRADPPVCRLVDYKKFKFDAKKKEKERKKQEVEQRREKVVKEVRLSSRTDFRDMEMKARAAKEHLALGYQIRCFVQFKKGDRRAGLGERLLPDMMDLLKDHGTVNKAPRVTGGRLEMYLRPLSLADRKKLPEYKKEAEKQSAKKGGAKETNLEENEDGIEITEAGGVETRDDEGGDYVEAAGEDTGQEVDGSYEMELEDDGRNHGEAAPDSEWEASTSDDFDDGVDLPDVEPNEERMRSRERLRKKRGGPKLAVGQPMSDLEGSFAALDADFDDLGEDVASGRANKGKRKRWSDQLRRPMRPKSALKKGDSDLDDEDEDELDLEHYDDSESGSGSESDDEGFDDADRKYGNRKQRTREPT